MSNKFAKIGIVGGGAWGTALAQAVAASGAEALLWAFEPETVREINDHHINRNYLPGVDLHKNLRATIKLADLAGFDAVLLVPPAQHLRRIAGELVPHMREGAPAIICAKGIEQATGKLMTQVLSEVLPKATAAILSGPSFAADVARGRPAALSLACEDKDVGKALANDLGGGALRIYWSDDLTGVALGGAIKNVLAIAAGIVDGKELGASAHAALVTRGFAELQRFGTALGASPQTLQGLSGLGDLILTCGSPQSRNMSLGRALGKGQSFEEVMGERKAVTEGVYTAEAVVAIARKQNIEMPISEAVHAIVTGKLGVDEAIARLMARPAKAELEA